MKKIKCLIVDDEPIARQIIAGYCNTIPSLEIAGACGNSFEAREMMTGGDIQLLFLDIHMPVLDGIAFLKTIKHPPQIIFTTAYKEYAATAFDLAACDYLVKPFSLERFIIAVDRAMERLSDASPDDRVAEDGYLVFKTEGKIYRIKYEQLLYAEASGNYTRVVTTETVIVLNMSFTSVEKVLPGSYFVRVHRSFIVNKSKISLIQGQTIFLDKVEIPIGKNFKRGLFNILGL
ncbi:response regulator transcription factor [Chitinophaga sp. G-6-1-13]|uniref:Response regulator transcription factor n=1 Tax=Chitinophaga fulva TaxID=2728842 RepID=A0A848GRP1_9BACT|nr:LytTR family DNA-binding domain-containing protein [Chitinophaga fulva]NML40029.1 response regulator transcription factor [Chitinophaga fulva]